MGTVVLVGAGASLAEALPSRPKRSELPPLDTTFFQLCGYAELDGRSAVQAYMTSTFGINPFRDGCRMEEIFNYIYSEAQVDSPTSECLSAYWALIKMYVNAVGRTTNSLSGSSRNGIGALMKCLFDDPAEGVPDFVTFNQDLVIEKALEAITSMAKYRRLPWNIRQAYGIPFSKFSGIGTTPKPFRDKGSGDSIRVLKLHGSFNWVYTVRSGEDPKNSVRNPSTAIWCLNDQMIRRQLGVGKGIRRRAMVPLVIPPIYEKSSKYKGVVSPIWAKAAEVLSAATRLVIFGYSFPDTDFAARSLLRRAFFANAGLKEVSIIDPDPRVATRVAELLSAPEVHLYRDVATFRSDQFPT